MDERQVLVLLWVNAAVALDTVLVALAGLIWPLAVVAVPWLAMAALALHLASYLFLAGQEARTLLRAGLLLNGLLLVMTLEWAI